MTPSSRKHFKKEEAVSLGEELELQQKALRKIIKALEEEQPPKSHKK